MDEGNGSLIGEQIKRSLRWLIVATVVLYLGLAGVALKTYTDSSATQAALCALRQDLQDRVNGSKDFLAKHPSGVPGISPKVIRDGIKNQSRTVAALKSLPCD